MNKITLGVCYFLFCVMICYSYSCSPNTNKSKDPNNKDTAVFQVGDDDNIDMMLFNYSKNNPYTKVYVFQEQDVDEYGNTLWVDWWIIDDFSEEEFNEMKKYADYYTFYDKVQNNTIKNRNYTWKNILRK